MNEHKIIQLGTFLEQDDKQIFIIDTDKWSRARNLNIKEKDRPIIKETDFMTFDDVEIYINSGTMYGGGNDHNGFCGYLIG